MFAKHTVRNTLCVFRPWYKAYTAYYGVFLGDIKLNTRQTFDKSE